MSDLVVLPNNISTNPDSIFIAGVAFASPDSGGISWGVSVPWNALPATVNSAIKAAAIAAADHGYTVGALDNKIIVGAVAALA